MMAGEYTMSVHMALQIVSILIGGPLAVVALPAGWTDSSPARRLSRILWGRPWLAWMTGTGTMWFWHIPAVHHLAMRAADGNKGFAVLQVLVLVAGGMLFSWPLLTPHRRLRIHPLAGIVYLATACVSCSLMGLLITFAPVGIYAGITRQDMQTAGLIMWIPGCLLYLAGCLLLLRRWLFEEFRSRTIFK
ncbi:MAG: cytochrome c oxidase assembly protein [Bacteroidetes bacterium]|nr:cytochrome c oxidase assembly protein [Bacteroidota bacterium]